MKVWNVGDVLTASDLNSWAVPLVGIKSADQTISSQSTYVNDADVRVALASSAMYEFTTYIRFSSGTGQDWKTSFTIPAGATCRFQQVGVDASGNQVISINDLTDTSVVTSKGAGVGTRQNAHFFGWITTAGTAGNFILQWSQNVSGAFNTTLYQNSYLLCQRIA